MPYPAPNLSDVPRLGDRNVLVETRYGPENRSRISIFVDAGGTFRLLQEFWDVTDFEIIGYAYWNQVASQSLTNDLGIARELAAEALPSLASTAQHAAVPI